MQWYQIESKFTDTPYIADTLSEPDDTVRGKAIWQVFSREDCSCLGEIEERKFLGFKHYVIKVYPSKNEEDVAERSNLIATLKQKHIPFVK